MSGMLNDFAKAVKYHVSTMPTKETAQECLITKAQDRISSSYRKRNQRLALCAPWSLLSTPGQAPASDMPI